MNISKLKLSTIGAISLKCSQSRHVCVTKKRIAPKSRCVEMRHFCTLLSAPLSYTCIALYSLALQVSRNALGLSELRHFLSALMLHFCALLWLSSIPLCIGRGRFATTSHPLRWCVPGGADKTLAKAYPDTTERQLILTEPGLRSAESESTVLTGVGTRSQLRKPEPGLPKIHRIRRPSRAAESKSELESSGVATPQPYRTTSTELMAMNDV